MDAISARAMCIDALYVPVRCIAPRNATNDLFHLQHHYAKGLPANMQVYREYMPCSIDCVLNVARSRHCLGSSHPLGWRGFCGPDSCPLFQRQGLGGHWVMPCSRFSVMLGWKAAGPSNWIGPAERNGAHVAPRRLSPNSRAVNGYGRSCTHSALPGHLLMY